MDPNMSDSNTSVAQIIAEVPGFTPPKFAENRVPVVPVSNEELKELISYSQSLFDCELRGLFRPTSDEEYRQVFRALSQIRYFFRECGARSQSEREPMFLSLGVKHFRRWAPFRPLMTDQLVESLNILAEELYGFTILRNGDNLLFLNRARNMNPYRIPRWVLDLPLQDNMLDGTDNDNDEEDTGD